MPKKNTASKLLPELRNKKYNQSFGFASFLMLTAVFSLISDLALCQVEDRSARNPEVIASYAIQPSGPRTHKDDFENAIRALGPRVREFCKNLLDIQKDMIVVNESWKLHSLYAALEKTKLMTGMLVRVPIVSPLVDSMPQYTNYRRTLTGLSQAGIKSLKNVENGAILISEPGASCGPDTLAPKKGSYFVKCGSYLLGSGLMKGSDYQTQNCKNISVLINSDLKN